MRKFDYSFLSKLQSLAADGRFELTDPEYSDVVRAQIRCLSENESEIRSLMTNLTSGQAVILSEEKGIIRVRTDKY